MLLPCLNEQLTVARCVRDALHGLHALGVTGEVLVIDNGSSDASVALARAAGARVLSAPHPGYGAALRAGILQARGGYVIMADADGTYDLRDLRPFWAALQAGAQIVVGDRFAGGVDNGAMPWPNRYLGNPALSWLARTVNGVPVHDVHCGLRAFDLDSITTLDLRCDGMEFATEMLAMGALAGFQFAEVPIRLHASTEGRNSHLRPLRDGLRHLAVIARLWSRRQSRLRLQLTQALRETAPL